MCKCRCNITFISTSHFLALAVKRNFSLFTLTLALFEHLHMNRGSKVKKIRQIRAYFVFTKLPGRNFGQINAAVSWRIGNAVQYSNKR